MQIFFKKNVSIKCIAKRIVGCNGSYQSFLLFFFVLLLELRPMQLFYCIKLQSVLWM